MNCSLNQSSLSMDSIHLKASPSPSKTWWSTETVAVVTGANKGIGLAFVKRFAELGLTVVLTARDVGKGQEAVESLKGQRIKHVVFCRLDVTDPVSVAAFAKWLQQKFRGLDILVNNAGVSFNDIWGNSVEHAETVIKTNFYGPKLLMEELMPLFRRSVAMSRILNTSSSLALQSKVSNPSLKELLEREENLSEDKVEHMVALFLDHVKRGIWKERGWPKVWTDYSVSKLALSAYSRLLAKQNKGHKLSINCFCPGFTRTAMTHGQGHRTAEKAAEIGVSIALLAPSELPTGEFFKIPTPSLTSKL